MGLFDLAKKQKSEDQTEDQKKLAAHVKSRVEEIRSSANRIAHEGIWMTNIAYMLGYDGLTFNTATRQFQPVNRANAYLKKNRIHVNKILPTIQNRLARLCKNPPKYDVLPETNDTEDKEASRLALQVLNALWERLEIDKKRLFLYMWTQECGHAWIKVYWDKSAGKPMVDPETNDLSYEGEVAIGIRSPFEVFPDPLARTDDDLEYIIEAKVRRLDYFKMNYPQYGGLVKEEGAWLLSSQFEQRINSLNSRGPSQGGLQDALKNAAIELIKYEKRSPQYPNGRKIVTANGILLEDTELPFGEIPFVKFDDIIIGGKFYSEAAVTHLRPIQDQYNETVRRRSQWTKLLLAGKYTAPRGGGLQQESMNDESGEVVYYDILPTSPDGGRPQPLQVPMIPQWAYMEEDKLDNMMNYISGISDVSRGTLPSASIPAIGMQLLTEQDDTRIGVMTEQHEIAWARVGQYILKTVEENYILPRKLKIAGRDLQYTVKTITGKDIRGNTDVKVIKGSTKPGSKTLKRQEIMNAWQQGLLGDPKDPKVTQLVLGMIEFGDVQGMWEDYGLDQNQIKKGIEKLEQGIPLPIVEFDNHPAWLVELNRYRKGDKFDSLLPTIQQLFIQQIEGHIQAIVKATVPPPQMEPEPPAPGAMSAPQPQPVGGPNG